MALFDILKLLSAVVSWVAFRRPLKLIIPYGNWCHCKPAIKIYSWNLSWFFENTVMELEWKFCGISFLMAKLLENHTQLGKSSIVLFLKISAIEKLFFPLFLKVDLFLCQEFFQDFERCIRIFAHSNLTGKFPNHVAANAMYIYNWKSSDCLPFAHMSHL